MANFEVMKADYAGISDNCIFELEKYITEKPKPLNFEEVKKFSMQICPSGNTFLSHHQEAIDRFLPYWEEEIVPADLSTVFK